MYTTIIIALLFTALLELGETAQISPFMSSLYTPTRMCRTTYTASSLQGTSSSFTVSYPQTLWNITPSVLYSVTAMTFNGGVNYHLRITSTSLTQLTAAVDHTSVLTQISFCFLIMDSILYPATFSQFSYTMPVGASGAQSFSVTGVQTHTAAFTVGMELQLGAQPGGLIPRVQSSVVTSADLISTNLKIFFDTNQISVKFFKMVFVDLNTSNFTAFPYDRSGQKWTIFGTSGIATDPYSTASSLSLYKNNYLMGLTVLYDGQFLSGGLSFNASTSITTGVFYFTSEILIISYYCPSQFPITDALRQYCYSDCDLGKYYDDQYICQLCDANCLTCFLTSTNCTSCSSPYSVIYGYVCGCTSTTYEVILSNGTINCQPCHLAISGCLTCSSQTVCTSCMSNLELTAPDICNCPTGTIRLSVDNNHYCINDGASPIAQACPNNYWQEGLSCQCTPNYNLTLVNGACNSLL